jgi:hypothetical protein
MRTPAIEIGDLALPRCADNPKPITLRDGRVVHLWCAAER